MFICDKRLGECANKTTNTPYKIGETAVAPNLNGTLPRPQSQVDKLNKTNTGEYQYQELGKYPGKQAVREAETNTIIEMRNEGNSLPGNKGLH